MDAAGAARITFNPLTPSFAVKALARVAEAEGLPLAPEAAKALAERCTGDLRAALEALQLAAAGAPAPPPPKKVAPAGCVPHLYVTGWRGVASAQRPEGMMLAGSHGLWASDYPARQWPACPRARHWLAIVKQEKGLQAPAQVPMEPQDSLRTCLSFFFFSASMIACQGLHER